MRTRRRTYHRRSKDYTSQKDRVARKGSFITHFPNLRPLIRLSYWLKSDNSPIRYGTDDYKSFYLNFRNKAYRIFLKRRQTLFSV